MEATISSWHCQQCLSNKSIWNLPLPDEPHSKCIRPAWAYEGKFLPCQSRSEVHQRGQLVLLCQATSQLLASFLSIQMIMKKRQKVLAGPSGEAEFFWVARTSCSLLLQIIRRAPTTTLCLTIAFLNDDSVLLCVIRGERLQCSPI